MMIYYVQLHEGLICTFHYTTTISYMDQEKQKQCKICSEHNIVTCNGCSKQCGLEIKQAASVYGCNTDTWLLQK